MQKCIKTYESGNDRSSQLNKRPKQLKKNQVSFRSFKENNTDDRILIFLVRITYRQRAPYEVVSNVYKIFFYFH